MLSLSPPRRIPDRRDRGAQNVRLNELKRTLVSRPIRRSALAGFKSQFLFSVRSRPMERYAF
jgi:hypothetical protein